SCGLRVWFGIRMRWLGGMKHLIAGMEQGGIQGVDPGIALCVMQGTASGVGRISAAPSDVQTRQSPPVPSEFAPVHAAHLFDIVPGIVGWRFAYPTYDGWCVVEDFPALRCASCGLRG